jgi:hypothetical protein
MLPATLGARQFKHRADTNYAAFVGCSVKISGSVHNQVRLWICAVSAAGEGINDLPLLAAAASGANANRTHADARKRMPAPPRTLRRMTAPRTRKKKIRPPTAGREEIVRRSASSVNVQTIAGDLMNSPNELFLPRQSQPPRHIANCFAQHRLRALPQRPRTRVGTR